MTMQGIARLGLVLEQIRALAAGDLNARGAISAKGDELDALTAALNTLAEDLCAREQSRVQAESRSATLFAYSKELERSNAALQEFAYVASHDLQEPLRMVLSYTALLEQRLEGKLDADEKLYLFYASDGARRMQQLVTDLLSYARVGGSNLRFERVDTSALVRGVIDELRVAIEASEATVEASPLPTITADRVQLETVFRNLIGNALKYRGETKPKVEIASRLRDDCCVFSIKDNGIGIDPRHFDRIFKLFQRLHERGTYPGTGIGLALCRRAVEAHGGDLWVESREGHGATFSFSLPTAIHPRAFRTQSLTD
jgi:light-regulated signal transduction histidine kinase (bacteriophytochrome)